MRAKPDDEEALAGRLTGLDGELDAGMLALVTLPTSPFWPRPFTRLFLDSCQGISADMTETAELIVSELVTNAVRFPGDPARILQYSERASASLIVLSLRNFCEDLLIEVYDADSNPPILSSADDHAENGRGLMLVDALSKEWSYFFPAGGGKVVYCCLEKHDPLPAGVKRLAQSRSNLRSSARSRIRRHLAELKQMRVRRRWEYPANR